MKHVITVEKLLASLVFVGTLTLALFGWDAERAMGRLDAISSDLSATSAHVQELSTNVASLTTKVDDHEHRITVIETTQNN